MKRLVMIAVLCAGPLWADPLDLIDYEGLFEQNSAAVEDISPNRSILRVGDVTLLRDPTQPRTYTGLDESGEGAVGCLVSILATIESALLVCEASLPPDQVAVQDAYLQRALAFYAENTVPAAPLDVVRDRYDALVAAQVAGARPFCANLDLVTDLARRIFAPESAAEIDGMMSIPRLPVANPCL